MTLALYRAYRPGTLAEVVGQDHVTAPLRRALSTGRVHHAYLFSGPRGCGKTSTARILARSLNCEQGPTPDPCGECDSCVALAPNGPGSEDVIELDAASHGGVDDTRELRERVIYSPARSRYRVYIIDEAHMVTTQGFNALLKVIEEPPDYVRFIFATTEPEKVLGTIRSRTFNYAFRLVSAGALSAHLAAICQAEDVPYDEAVLPLIAKASGGSVRDALSILGQLIAGSGDDGLTMDVVSGGLGLTDTVLLDRVVTAIAARDGAAAFQAVDAVVESGHDGRRFLTDLLGRLRDLIVLQHLPVEEQGQLLQLPADQVEALRGQGELFGASELSRAADLVSAGLSELKGATAPRLQLELLLARLLLPAADDAAAGLAARLDRLERSMPTASGATGGPAARPASAAPPRSPDAVATHQGPTRTSQAGPADATAAAQPSGPARADEPAAAAAAPTRSSRPDQRSDRAARRGSPPPRLSDIAPSTSRETAHRRRPDPGAAASPSSAPDRAIAPACGRLARGRSRAGAPRARPASAAESRPRSVESGDSGASGASDASEVAVFADGWPSVLAELGKRSRVAWALWESSRPLTLADGVLSVGVADQGRLTSIRASRREELLRQVLIDVLRQDVKVAPVLTDAAPPEPESGAASPDDPDLGGSDVSGVDLVIREFGAVAIGEIGET